MKTLKKIKDEKLLLKAFSAMLPYGVICKIENVEKEYKLTKIDVNDFGGVTLSFFIREYKGRKQEFVCTFDQIKPYLRSLNDMTEEEEEEFNNIPSTKNYQIVGGDLPWDIANYKQLDWLLEHRFNIFLPENLYIKVSEKNNPYK